MNAYAVSKTIFKIKATEYNIKISTPMLSVSGKNDLSFYKRLDKNQWWWFRWVTINIPSSYKDKTGKNSVTEDLEYGIDELPE